jgi:hypothetical protein
MAAVNPAQPLPTMITFSTYQSSMSRKLEKAVAGGSAAPRAMLFWRRRRIIS